MGDSKLKARVICNPASSGGRYEPDDARVPEERPMLGKQERVERQARKQEQQA